MDKDQGGLYFTIRHIKHWTEHLDKFWELHPSATRMGCLRSLYKNDKSKNKYVSSRKMWFCILYCHPESDFFNLVHEDKIADLGHDCLPANTKSFQKAYVELTPCIKYAEKALMTPSQRQIVILRNKFDERAEVYASNPYTLENAKVLDDMIKNAPMLMKTMQACEDVIKESAKDGAIKGGGELSLLESGGLFNE